MHLSPMGNGALIYDAKNRIIRSVEGSAAGGLFGLKGKYGEVGQNIAGKRHKHSPTEGAGCPGI